MFVFPLDVSNALQTNIESNPSERVYISIPPFYLEYFFTNGLTILSKALQQTSFAFKLSDPCKVSRMQVGNGIFFSKQFASMSLVWW